MPDILTVQYARTGDSTKQNPMGMREMQARAYERRGSQYLLIKAPPASGKSRALMFLALDKVEKQGLEKVIVAVPEMSIGGSFKDTNLTERGFFANWHVDPRYNLCTAGNEGKVDRVVEFMKDEKAHYLVCTHATFRFAYEKIADPKAFNKALVAIDEFHHTSAEEGNILGGIIDELMAKSSAHIVAMTGSYFRGDAVPILKPEDEARFTQVTYTYYEQLNGYKYLKSLGIGYHFYQGRYFDALHEVLDPAKKTIVHIPNVNSMESTGKKLAEVDKILDVLGTVESQAPDTGIYTVKTRTNRRILVADLVTDDAMRSDVLAYLRNITSADQMDVIIALGMAKEGFDWPWCEHVLTIGYRGSLTEIVQIIGRATRDCEGKTHAQFTNLIAQPDAEDEDVKVSVNNMLKAISVSLLMEQVLAPNINFRPRALPGQDSPEDPFGGSGRLTVRLEPPMNATPRVRKILEEGGTGDVITAILQEIPVIAPMVTGSGDPKVFREEQIPKVVRRIYPDLSTDEAKDVSDAVFKELVLKNRMVAVAEQPQLFVLTEGGTTGAVEVGSQEGSGAGEERERIPQKTTLQLLKVGEKFVNIEELDIDLIADVNPFQGAYEILSKAMDAKMLKTIQDVVTSSRSGVTEEEAVLLWSNVQAFVKENGREPSPQSNDQYERLLAEVLAYARRRMAEERAKKEAAHG